MKALYTIVALAVAACSTPQLQTVVPYEPPTPKPTVKPQPTTLYLKDLSSYLDRGTRNAEDDDPASLTPLEYCRTHVEIWAGNRIKEFERSRAGSAILVHLIDMCLRRDQLSTVDTNKNGRLDQGDDKDGDNNLTDLDGIVE